VSAQRRAFPLVPRRRLQGTPFGERSSSRRGHGTDVATTRPYVPGDPVGKIDWFASARVSAATGQDNFVVRETYAEEAPRVMIVVDRAPSLSLYGDGLPWLDKRAAIRTAADAIGRAAMAARAELGLAEGSHVLPPGAVAPRHLLDRVRRLAADGVPGDLARALAALARRRAEAPQGTFVFVLSDFLDPVPSRVWSSVRTTRWDVVPVVVMDPTWERSFPDVGGVTIPFALPGEETPVLVRLDESEAAGRRVANEGRLAALLARFRRLDFDPLLLGSSEPAAVDAAFLRWANVRKLRRRRR
jgi:uncharacterized protein (DUF58 family)